MESYRLYLYDPEGRVDRAVELVSRSDAEALELLDEHAVRHPLMELWNEQRLVASYGTNPSTARRPGRREHRPRGATNLRPDREGPDLPRLCGRDAEARFDRADRV